MLRARPSSSLAESQPLSQSSRGWPAAASSLARRHAASFRRTLSIAALPLLLLAYIAVRLTVVPHSRGALTEPGATARRARHVKVLRVFVLPLDPAMSFGLLNSSASLSLAIPARLVPIWNHVTGSSIALPPSPARTRATTPAPAPAALSATPPTLGAVAPEGVARGESQGGASRSNEGAAEGEEEEDGEMVTVQVAAYDAQPHVYAYSAEYWLALSLFTGLPSVRVVAHPSQADALFLPLFSSLLLFRSAPPNASDPLCLRHLSLRTPPALLSSLLSSVASLLQQHQPPRAPLPLLLPAMHPHALAPLKVQLAAAHFMLTDISHTSPQAVSLGKDVVVPLASVVPPLLVDSGEWAQRPTLAFFHGPPQSAERVRLAAVLAGSIDFDVSVWGEAGTEEQVAVERARAEQGMRTAKFCLVLPGEVPSSVGLVDAIMSGCVPVLLVSSSLPAPALPLEASVPYAQLVRAVPLRLALRARYLLEALGVVKRHEWMRMWYRLREFRESFLYSSPPREGGPEDLVWQEMAFRVRHGREAREGEERRRQRQEELSALLVAAGMAAMQDADGRVSTRDYG
ncbi:hypothetical protein CLOM_g14377 [Closterium sp. NIES-68]|nr:hypothetical protein CLOM_g14377 [Closterium sp. NIES-68]GJP84232.1 hypothetical protein CLOP_g14319 [Closterium sp. NIES-67]